MCRFSQTRARRSVESYHTCRSAYSCSDHFVSNGIIDIQRKQRPVLDDWPAPFWPICTTLVALNVRSWLLYTALRRLVRGVRNDLLARGKRVEACRRARGGR